MHGARSEGHGKALSVESFSALSRWPQAASRQSEKRCSSGNPPWRSSAGRFSAGFAPTSAEPSPEVPSSPFGCKEDGNLERLAVAEAHICLVPALSKQNHSALCHCSTRAAKQIPQKQQRKLATACLGGLSVHLAAMRHRRRS